MFYDSSMTNDRGPIRKLLEFPSEAMWGLFSESLEFLRRSVQQEAGHTKHPHINDEALCACHTFLEQLDISLAMMQSFTSKGTLFVLPLK